MEEFCEQYNTDDILKTIIRRRDKQKDFVNLLFKCIDNLNQWTIKPLKVMLTFAITHGNPLFEKIPLIIRQVKEEYHEEIIGHLKYATQIEFGEHVAKWIG